MRLFSSLIKAVETFRNEFNTPESFKIGQKFEEYVREYLFTDKYFDLIERTHDYNTNSRDYVESSLKPDFTFRDKRSRHEFYVEAKFRSSFYKGKINWCNENQLQRYRYYNEERPVFLILGMGDDPKYPEFLSLMPLDAIKYTSLYLSFAEQFEIRIDQSISSNKLWER